MNRNNIFNTIKKYREKSGDEFGILRIGVFGSLAKGQENSASDVDVVVDFEASKYLILLKLTL
ncbi:DNA polymerase beta domain protein region [Desulfonatronospira thiodismutans ASO3-1]|uniref:DNA polymerase beta domain protein region n=1 Tax=Desulfonatronospira thiodismutans ASO3-1 TaxID=555779 RepID=D6SRT9_9BACT|nr:nucleotidyltransferase domain-containing protein [Desulfonatronospira thiodismutans]EFI33405.1 DNA polymerase beta domain protein region [Desulfonatronospira thiodismutans ASO3-1]